MAINDGFYWYKNVLKKQLKLASRVYLSIAIVLAPIFLMSSANAANVGGWTLGGAVAQGASTVYDATKNVVINGKKFIKESSVKITPSASQVAKVLARGGAGYALSVAVEQLLGSVDWVLDPANNRIIYNGEPTDIDDPALKVYFLAGGGSKHSSAAAAAAATCQFMKTAQSYYNLTGSYTSFYVGEVGENRTGVYCTMVNGGTSHYSFDILANPNYDPNAETEEKYLPLPVVAQKVISNAESGDTDAQAATTAAAADIVAEAETDNTKARPIASQAEANATTKPADAAEAEKANEAQGETKPNEANPEATDLSLTFPIFCNWAPTICEAAQTVISFPQTLTNWWETGKTKAEEWATSISESWVAAKEWATSEPQEQDSNELEFEDLNIDADQVNLSGSSACPQDSVSFSVMGKSVTLDMPYQPVCDALNFFKPAVLLVGAVASVYIVAGVRTKEEDQA